MADNRARVVVNKPINPGLFAEETGIHISTTGIDPEVEGDTTVVALDSKVTENQLRQALEAHRYVMSERSQLLMWQERARQGRIFTAPEMQEILRLLLLRSG